MYHYLDNKEFISKMRSRSGQIMQTLCHFLKEKYGIGCTFYLVGSGAKNLITQNENEPVDLDYNLEIVKCDDFSDCRGLKESVRKAFNKVLRKYRLPDCDDSASVLTSKKICLEGENSIAFSIDICIVKKDANNGHSRLIHEKTGFVCEDHYYWNTAPKSQQLKEKVRYIKENNRWQTVREEYLKIKNRYLVRNDHNHSSFVCYIEAVNNVFYAMQPLGIGLYHF